SNKKVISGSPILFDQVCSSVRIKSHKEASSNTKTGALIRTATPESESKASVIAGRTIRYSSESRGRIRMVASCANFRKGVNQIDQAVDSGMALQRLFRSFWGNSVSQQMSTNTIRIADVFINTVFSVWRRLGL